MNKKSLFLACASMFMLASCGSDPATEEEEVLITSVGTNPTELKLIAGNAPTEVAYRVFGRGKFDKTVKLSSSNEAVATATLVEGKEAFKVAPLAVGESVITVKANGDESKAATLKVTVEENEIKPTKPHVTGLSLDKTAARCYENSDPIEFTVTVEGEGNYDVAYIVNNEHPDLVDVDITEGTTGSSFHVTPKAPGTALIDVISHDNKDIKQQIQILIDPVIPEKEEVRVRSTPLRKIVDVGDTFNIIINEHTHDVSWEVEDDTIVQISNTSNDGATVTALEYGESKVTAKVSALIDGVEEVATADTVIEVVPSGDFKGYKVVLNNETEISLVKGEPGRDGVVEHYEATLNNVDAGTRVDFAGVMAGGLDLITYGIGPDADDKEGGVRNNLKPSEAGRVDFTVQNDVVSEKLYFDIWSDGGISFWLDGGLAYVEGFYLSVNGVPDTLLVKNEEYVGDGEEYKAIGVELEVGDIISLYDGSTDASWMPKLEPYGDHDCFTIEDGKTVCIGASTFDFYIKLIYQNDSVYVESQTPIEEPTYSFAINGGSPIELVLDDDGKFDDVEHQYAASVPFEAGDELTFYRNDVEFDSINVESGANATQDFKIIDSFIPEEGHNSIYLKHMKDSSFNLYVAGKQYVAPWRIVGLNGWSYDDGVQMVKKEDSETEFVAEITVNAGDAFKVWDGEDAWITTYKFGETEDSALLNNLAYIDISAENNCVFRVGGTYKVYFDTLDTNYGVYVSTLSVAQPYTGIISDDTEDLDSALLDFSKVELYPEHGGMIEYKIKGVPLTSGLNLRIEKDDSPIEFELENDGAYSLFELVGTTLKYKGTGGSYDFYLKQDLETGNFLLFVQGEVPATTYKVVGIEGDWSFDKGISMDPVGGSETEYVAEITVNALDNIKIRSSTDEWFSGWKVNCGEGDNAIDNLEAYVYHSEDDSNGNLIFRVSGTFKVYFDTAAEASSCIYVATQSVSSPYTGLLNGEDSAPFEYHNVELYPEHGGRIEYMIEDITLKNGDTLQVMKDSTAKTVTIEDGGAKSLFELNDNTLTYKGEGGDYTFYLKEDLEDPTQLTVYISGDVPTPESAWKIVSSGTATPWAYSEGAAMSLKKDSETEYVGEITVKTGDMIKLTDSKNWADNWKESGGDDNAIVLNQAYVIHDEGENKGNLCFRVGGTYEIFYQTDANNNPGIYVHNLVVSTPYTGQITTGSGPLSESFEFNTIDVSKNIVEYKILKAPLEKNDTLQILVDANAQDFTLETGGASSLFSYENKVLTYSGDGGNYDFYLKEDVSTHKLTLYIGAEIQQKTYTITCTQTGAFENCEVFIWAWKDGQEGSWYKTEVIAGKPGLTFTLPENLDRFLVVRCYVGTTTPNWDEKGDKPGRIYNQTGNYTIDSKTQNYAIEFPNW